MFARSTLRVASRRAFQPITATAPAFRAGFKSTVKANDPETVQEKNINVTSYHEGARTEENLPVVGTGTGPVAPPGGDVQKTAVAMKADLFEQLTPTLKKFTLAGKVAIVTG